MQPQANPAGFWQPLEARLTLFPLEPHDSGAALNWWNAVAGDLPEASDGSPREKRESHRGTIELAGVALPVNLSTEPARIDWRVSLLPPVEAPGVTAEAFLEALAEIADRWFPSAPPSRRLALGTVVVHPVPEDESLAAIGQLTGIPVDGATSDFLFQINRSRPSNVVEGLVVNRLAKFTIMALQLLRIAIRPGRVAPLDTEDVLRGIRLELDINSDGRRADPLAADSLRHLFDEFATLTKEIWTDGHRP